MKYIKKVKKMLKKKYSFLPLLVLVVLTSCTSKAPRTLIFSDKLPESFLKNNAVQYPENRFKGYTHYNEIPQYDDFGNISTLNYTNNFTSGNSIRQTFSLFKVITGESARYGVYDLKEKRQVLPAEYSNIILVEASYYKASSSETIPYVYAVLRKDDRYSSNYQHSLYNVNERAEVMSEEEATVTPLYGIETRQVGNHTVETITRRSQVLDWTTVQNKVTFDSFGQLNRTEIRVDEHQIVTPDKTYVTDSPSLVAYSYEFLDTKIIGYKEDIKKFEVSLPLPPLGTITSEFIFDKYFILQLSSPVAADAKDYTFYDSGAKYLMTTTKIDLTTGKVTNMKKFPYFISKSFNAGKVYLQKDNDLKKTLGILSISKVEDKILLRANLVLFNSELTPLANLTTLNYNGVYYNLGSNRFLTANKEIVDENYIKVHDLSLYTNISYIPGHNLISLRYNGYYGLINASGNVIVPFQYNSAFVFYNGNAFNFNNTNSTSEKIATDGTTASVNSNLIVSPDEPGLLRRDFGSETTYYNYLESPLFTINRGVGTTVTQANIYHQNGQRFGLLYTIYEYGVLTQTFIIH